MTGEALFERIDDALWVASDFSRGPWHPGFCHGGPVAALLTRALEHHDESSWQLATHLIELTRPVPVGPPLRLTVEVDRPGRKVSVLTTTVHDGETLVARSRVVRIRSTELPIPDDVPEPTPPLRTVDQCSSGELTWDRPDQIAFHSHSNEFRVAEGDISVRGPIGLWVRLRVPLVAGEEPSGLQRAAAAADFGNGISAALPAEEFTFINPDLIVNAVRTPRGEWIGMRSSTQYGKSQRATGVAFAESELFDADGRFGRSTQSLVIERAT